VSAEGLAAEIAALDRAHEAGQAGNTAGRKMFESVVSALAIR